MPYSLTKDIRNITEQDLKGFDAVVHLAELSNDPVGELDPNITFKINHQGTVELAKKAKKVGVKRFVYFSSCSVYGASSTSASDESGKTNPLTAYAKCKLLVEADLKPMADNSFHPTFLRNATAYGASPRQRFDLVVNNLAGLAWTTKQIKMDSDGTPWRPFVHVLDICQAAACTLEAPDNVVHNETFNVGDNSENYQVKDIAKIISETFPGCSLSIGTRGRRQARLQGGLRQDQQQAPRLQVQVVGQEGGRAAPEDLPGDRHEGRPVPESLAHAAEADPVADPDEADRQRFLLDRRGQGVILSTTAASQNEPNRPPRHSRGGRFSFKIPSR
jgi:nucleoside-diphosphate-sugar epimerase